MISVGELTMFDKFSDLFFFFVVRKTPVLFTHLSIKFFRATMNSFLFLNIFKKQRENRDYGNQPLYVICHPRTEKHIFQAEKGF